MLTAGHHRNALYLDLELTCWSTTPPTGMKPEIIEVGVVRMDLDHLIISDEASYFVRPKLWEISSKCTKITGITAEDIRTAKRLSKVMDAVAERFSPAALPCFAWGDDVEVLAKACKEFRCGTPFRRGMDLSTAFQAAFAMKERSSLLNAVSSLGLTFDGFTHGALPDARNTALLHAAMLRRLRLKAPQEKRAERIQSEPSPLSSFAQKLAACLDHNP